MPIEGSKGKPIDLPGEGGRGLGAGIRYLNRNLNKGEALFFLLSPCFPLVPP